ncbi:hypothetical protein SSRP02_p032 [Synechococcus phage S-SRP02]|nr:hypothetical protein SSRP02_p032 [Synechococcus phage S-SRP02]
MSNPNLPKRLADIYWHVAEVGGFKNDATQVLQMKPVILEIANLIRTWAPDEGQYRICFMAINEVADKLARMAEISE